MNISAEVNRIQIGEKSRALREKLVDRTLLEISGSLSLGRGIIGTRSCSDS